MKKFLVASLSILGLVASSLVASTPAFSAGSVQKTVTVRDASGDLYAGAKVQLLRFNDASQILEFAPGESTLTNNMGVATLTVPSVPLTGTYRGIVIEPLLEDQLTSYVVEDLDRWDQSFSVNLVAANATVRLETPAGYVFPGSSISFLSPDGELVTRYALEDGAIGLYLDPSSGPLEAYVQPGDKGKSGTNVYDISFAGGLPIFSRDEVVIEPINGVLQLPIPLNYVSGSLLDSESVGLTLPANSSAWIEICDATDSYSCTAQRAFSSSSNPSVPGTEFMAAMPSTKPGTYPTSVIFEGGTTLVSQPGPTLEVNAEGDIREGDSGVFTSFEFFSFNFIVDTAIVPNLSLQTLGNTPSYFYLFSSDLDRDVGSVWSPNGATKLNLPNGTYSLTTIPTNRSWGSQNYVVTVTDDLATVSTLASSPVPTNGSFTVGNSSAGNLLINPISSSDGSNLNHATANLFGEGDSHIDSYAFMGQISITLPAVAGEYSLVLSPNNSPDPMLVRTSYSLSVALGSDDALTLVLKDSAGVVVFPADGVYDLPLDRANFELNVQNPNGTTPYSQDFELDQYLDVEVQKSINEGEETQFWQWHDWIQGSGDKVFGKVGPGTYRLIVNPLNDEDRAQAISQVFVITGNEGPGATLQLGNLRLATPNLKVKALWQGVTQPDLQINIQSFDSPGEEFRIRTSWNSPNIAVFAFTAAGNYNLKLQNSDIDGASETTYNVTVVEVDGVFIPSIDGVSAVGGVFSLDLLAGNLALNVFDVVDTLATSVSISLERRNNGNWETVQSAWAQDGRANMNVEPGIYQIRLTPNGSSYLFSQTILNLTVNDQSVPAITNLQGVSTPRNEDGSFNLQLDMSNVYGQLMVDSSTPLTKSNSWEQYVNVNLQVKNSAGFWEWAGYDTQPDDQGYFGFRILKTGTYRVTAEPNGYENISSTNFQEFIITTEALDSLTDLGQLVFSEPIMRVKVTLSGSNIGLRNAGLEIRQEGSSISWVNTGQSAAASISFPGPGTYQLVAHPSGDSSKGTPKEYTVVVTSVENRLVANVNGQIIGTNGVWSLELGIPTISGKVLDPEGNLGVRNTQIVAINQETGDEMWEETSYTDLFGNWNMTLPEGTYKLRAKAPGRSLIFGDGPSSSLVTVSSSGVATVTSGLNTTNFDLRLGYPTWLGVVVAPGTETRLADANICLRESASQRSWSCTQADSDGNWALSASESFTGFAVGSELSIEDSLGDFSTNTISGSAISAVLGVFVVGQTFPNRVLSPAVSNLEITIRAGEFPAPRVWVNLDRDNIGWLGGKMTDENGVARFTIENPYSDLNVQTSLEGNTSLSGQFAPTRKVVPSESLGAETRLLQVDLNESNFFAQISEPGVSGLRLRGAWVEYSDSDSGQWLGGMGSDSSGNIGIYLPKPESGSTDYRLSISPPGNSTSGFSKNIYYVNVTYSGVFTVTDSAASANPVPSGGLFYQLTLAETSVTGNVIDSSGSAIRDSWVVPLNNAIPSRPDYLWESGSHSRSNGSFGLNLSDGGYLIEANPAWNSSGSSRSARCSVTVAEGRIASGDSSCWNQNTGVTLTLRPPNVKFKLTDGVNPVPFANVGVGYGPYNTWVQSDAQGNVELFIDAVEIVSLSPNLNEGDNVDLRIWVDPPSGSSDLVRWDCNSSDDKPLCQGIPDLIVGQQNSYLATPIDLGSIAFAEPNTRLRVMDSSGNPVGAGAWVGLLVKTNSESCSDCYEWVSGSGTNSQGFAAFDVDSAILSGSFKVEVNAPWNQRTTLAGKSYQGLSYAAVNNQTFALSSPNLKVQVTQAFNVQGARWSWIGVEEVNPGTFASTSWLTGAGTDNSGRASLSLAASKTFRLTAHPGQSDYGATSSCLVETDDQGVVELLGTCAFSSEVTSETSSGVTTKNMQLKLSSGNVSGIVSSSTGIVVAGAIVYAEAEGREAVSTVTNAQGGYSLQLDTLASGFWSIKVFAVSRPGDTVQLNSNLAAGTINPGVSVSVVRNLTLQVAP